MYIHLFLKGKLENEALSRLLTSSGYHIAVSQSLHPLSNGSTVSSDHTVLLTDVETYAAEAASATGLLADRCNRIILLGKPEQLHCLFTCPASCKSFVSKKETVRNLFASIDRADDDGMYLSEGIIYMLWQPEIKRQQEFFQNELEAPLTSTELGIMQEIGRGKTTQQISKERFRSSNTINNHRKNILRKLNLEGPVALVRFAVQQTDAIKTLVALKENRPLVEDLIKNDER